MSRLARWWREWREAREEYRASVEEMQFHIEQETEHNVRNGMSRREARRAARRAFGGVDRFAEAARDQRAGTRWRDFRLSYLDWKLGARLLAKHPAVSIIGGLTLAAAIGLGAGWFEMTMMLFRPELPLADGDRIVRMEYWNPATLRPEQRTLHEFVQWREGLRTVEHVGAYRTVQRNLVAPGAAPRVVDVAEMSAAGFTVARVPPLLGRHLIPADEAAGAGDVVVLGYDAWQRYFDADPAIVGREVQLGRARATVAGVMPEGFRFPSHHQFWMPLRPGQPGPLEGGEIRVFGRLRPGVDAEQARAELVTWSRRMAQTSPAAHAGLRIRVLPFAASGEIALRSEAFLINLAAWLILVAACANVAALMFARTALREGEIVVRNALGASRARVLGQLFTEALVLTTVAAVLGLLAARGVMAWVIERAARRGAPVPFWWEANIEPVTLLYTAGLAVAGAAMVGLLPAIRATGPQLRTSLEQVGSGRTSIRFGGAWSAIIVLQVAFSVLSLGFGIAAASEAYQQGRLRAAYPADAYLTFRPVLDPAADTTGSRARLEAVVAELVRRLEGEPEVADVAMTTALPGTYHPLHRMEVQRGSEPPTLIDANTEGDRVRTGGVGPAFFETFQRPLLAGRTFTEGDVSAPYSPVIINEALARNLGGNAVGARVRFAADQEREAGPWHEVVGVVGNFDLTPTRQGEADYLYTPIPTSDVVYLVLRMNGDAAGFAHRLRTVAFGVEPSLRLQDVLSLREVIRRYDESMVHGTLAGIGVVLLALVLSAASLYALMSVAVALRTREIGIRLAIGGSPLAVLSSVFRRAATQLGIGIIAGNVVVLLLLSVMLEELQPGAVIPPLAAASVVMLLVGLGSCLAPARRALRIQPTDAIRAAR